jgi:hypothetical protein
LQDRSRRRGAAFTRPPPPSRYRPNRESRPQTEAFEKLAETQGFEPWIGLYNPITV